MIEQIYKYPVEISSDFTINMPVGSTVLAVQVQRGVPFLWARVNPEAPVIARRFRVFGTGHANVFDGLRFIGTFQLDEGSFVGHLFEVIKIQGEE